MKSQREKTIPKKPRFGYVTKIAYDFLLELGYNKFPIEPFKVFEDLSEYVTCLPWSEARNTLKSKDPFHLKELHAEARTIRSRNEGKYYIVFDDVEVNSDNRIRWTIMHEIGHIVLGHLTDFGETALDRGGLTKKKYGVLEIEAHYFAAEVLMPTSLLKFFSDITVDEISLLFGVSDDAATRKYKRVFKATYMPDSPYDDKLIRNFFDFLDNDVDKTIYKNIYRQRGMPVNSKYVSLCRKCPDCYTYISDTNAVYCYYCGSEIDPKIKYNNVFDKMRKQCTFNQIEGFSHPTLPYAEIKSYNGESHQRVKYCPTCLNNKFSDDASYCSICGQPLYSVCTICETTLDINECFCPKCGAESDFHKYYKEAEKRIKRIKDCTSQVQYSEDWLEYPYWGYVRFRIIANENRKVSNDLKAALLYSNAYIDDEDNVIIFTDTAQAASLIYLYRNIVFDFIRRSDNIDYNKMEVYVTNDVR